MCVLLISTSSTWSKIVRMGSEALKEMTEQVRKVTSWSEANQFEDKYEKQVNKIAKLIRSVALIQTALTHMKRVLCMQ